MRSCEISATLCYHVKVFGEREYIALPTVRSRAGNSFNYPETSPCTRRIYRGGQERDGARPNYYIEYSPSAFSCT
jgi:hypothetical protein